MPLNLGGCSFRHAQIAIVPAGEHINRMRPGLKAVALEGVEPTKVVLAVCDGDRNPLLKTFTNSPS